MEQGVLIEGPHGKLGSTHASRSSRSQTTIDSISIDLDGRLEDDSKCDHFTIRGLTAKMRKKNGNLCWPFEVDGKEKVSEDIISKLPPLVVPSFRYWRCKTCLHDASVNGATCCSFDGKGKRTEVQETTDADSKKNAALESKVINHVNGLTHEMNMEKSQASDVRNTDPVGMLRMHEDISAVEPNGTGFSEKSKMNSRRNTVADSVVAIGNSSCQFAKDSSICDQPTKLVKSSETSSIDSQVNSHENAVSDHTRCDPSLEIDPRKASSEADENLDRDLLQDQHHDDSNGARKRTRKVRLLTELLNEKGSTNAGQSRKNDALSKESVRTGSDSVSPSVVVMQGNIGRGLRGQKKKKKKHMPNDPEWKHPKVISPHKFKKKYKGDGETSNAQSKSSKDDATVAVGKEASAKRIMNNHGADAHPVTQAKTKKSLDESECLLLFPSQEAGNSTEIRTGDSDVNAAADAVVVHPVISRVADPLLRRILPSDRYEKESSLPVREDILQVEGSQASFKVRNSGMHDKHSVTREQLENIQNPVSTPFPLAPDEFSTKDPYLSLNSFLDTQKDTWNSFSHSRYDLNLVRPMQHGVSRDHVVQKHDGLNGVRESNSSCKSASDTNTWNRVYTDSDIKRSTQGTSLTCEKRDDNNLPYVERNSFKSRMLLQELSGKSKNVKMDGVQEPLRRQHSSQGSENAFELGALDDIPMEIVELLAKNQYERRLNEAKSGQRHLETTSKRNSGITMDYTRLNTDAASRPSGKHRAWLESQGRYARNDKPTRGELSTNRPVNIFPQWIPLGDTGKTYSLPQSNPLRPVAPIGSGGNGSHHKGKFDGDLLSLGHKLSPSSLHAFKPYEACQKAPQQSEKAINILSPMTQNHLSSTAQNHAAPSFNQYLLPKSPRQVQKQNVSGGRNLKIPDLNFTEGEKQNRNYYSGASKMDAEKSYPVPGKRVGIQSNFLGPKDTNSNEAVSAMYLLSLMDSVRSPPPTLSLDGTSKFLKRPSLPHHHQVTEFQKLDFGVCENNQNPSQPLFNYSGKQKPSGMSCQCSPIPTIDVIASSQQNNASSRNAGNIPSQNRLTSREKGKSKLLYPPTANSGSKPWKSAFSPVVFAPTGNTIPVNGIEKKFLSASQPMGGSSKGLAMGYPVRPSNLVPNSPSEPGKRSSETEVCTVNRNPADFSVPGPGNIYMRGVEESRRKKSRYSRDNFDSVKSNSNGQKRQRITKIAAAKEWVRHQIS